MYKRLYTFLNNNIINNNNIIIINNNNIIILFSITILTSLQFGFRQHYSTSHALINITENIRKALDKGNIGCGVFVDLQRVFDTADHQILLAKLKHYGIPGVSNDWFKSCLSNCNLSINGYDSGLAAIKCGVPPRFCSRATSISALYK